MIWRFLCLLSASHVLAYVDRHYDRGTMWVVSSLIMLVLLPLSEIERRLAELIKVAKA